MDNNNLIILRCTAEANPEPDIVWRKAGGESIFRYLRGEIFVRYKFIANKNISCAHHGEQCMVENDNLKPVIAQG